MGTKLTTFIRNFPSTSHVSSPRPYINHSVEFKKPTTPEERLQKLEEAGLNVFFFPSELISGCDFLSDSGTTTMTNEQWAAVHLGDEAYGSNRGYFMLQKQINETFGEGFFNSLESGKPNGFIFHQGRAAENALFSILSKIGKNLLIPSNGHFDTTEANIAANEITPLNLFSQELFLEGDTSHFKGNMDTKKLEELFTVSQKNIPLVYLTVTNNTGGGQPVSMENIRKVSEIAHAHKTPFFLDACRFAENAWFIKQYEKGYASKRISAIILEMFSYADGFTISFKKDGLVNMGGGLFIKNSGLFMEKYPHIPDELMNHQIRVEGHPTYGGLSGRDIMALVYGLKTIVKEEYLDYRIQQVTEFGEELHKRGIPIMNPVGGHAVYIDVNKFFAGTKLKGSDFGGISLTALLLGLYGHRACELGYFAFGKYDPKTQIETHPDVNFVRLAIPRLRYEQRDLLDAANSLKSLHENRDKIPPINVLFGRELPLRHFKARFSFHNY